MRVKSGSFVLVGTKKTATEVAASLREEKK
jgi:hypothetical protein